MASEDFDNHYKHLFRPTESMLALLRAGRAAVVRWRWNPEHAAILASTSRQMLHEAFKKIADDEPTKTHVLFAFEGARAVEMPADVCDDLKALRDGCAAFKDVYTGEVSKESCGPREVETTWARARFIDREGAVCECDNVFMLVIEYA